MHHGQDMKQQVWLSSMNHCQSTHWEFINTHAVRNPSFASTIDNRVERFLLVSQGPLPNTFRASLALQALLGVDSCRHFFLHPLVEIFSPGDAASTHLAGPWIVYGSQEIKKFSPLQALPRLESPDCLRLLRNQEARISTGEKARQWLSLKRRAIWGRKPSRGHILCKVHIGLLLEFYQRWQTSHVRDKMRSSFFFQGRGFLSASFKGA